MVAADAERVVLRTIAAESAIFVLLNISYLPAELSWLVVILGFPDNSAPTSGAEQHDLSGHSQEWDCKTPGLFPAVEANVSFQITFS